MREKITWAEPLVGNSVSNTRDTVTSFKLKASYVYRAKYGGSLAYFRTGGSADALAYQTTSDIPDPNDPNATITVPGSPLGTLSEKPGASGWIPEVFWTPVQYVRVGLQYTLWNKFNGARTNYDGNGRNAHDNNTLYFYVWGAY